MTEAELRAFALGVLEGKRIAEEERARASAPDGEDGGRGGIDVCATDVEAPVYDREAFFRRIDEFVGSLDRLDDEELASEAERGMDGDGGSSSPVVKKTVSGERADAMERKLEERARLVREERDAKHAAERRSVASGASSAIGDELVDEDEDEDEHYYEGYEHYYQEQSDVIDDDEGPDLEPEPSCASCGCSLSSDNADVAYEGLCSFCAG